MMVLQYYMYQKGDKPWIKLLVGYLFVSQSNGMSTMTDGQTMNWVITIYCMFRLHPGCDDAG